MKKTFIKKYLINKYFIGGSIIFLIIAYFIFFSGSKNKKIDFVLIGIDNISQKVSVTGKVFPIEKADLAFEKGGRLTSINVIVGQKVKKGDILATLDTASDRASLASAEAKLADLSRGLNEPEFALEKVKIDAASVALSNAKQDALDTVRSALITTQGAINNYADIFFNDPRSYNPTINIITPSILIQNSINRERLLVSESLEKWKISLLKISTTTEDVLSLISEVNNYEILVKRFMDNLFVLVKDLNTSNSGLSRSVIDSYITTMNSGLTALDQAVSSITLKKTALENAASNYNQVYNNFLLKNSGSSAQSVASQSATVETYRAELLKNILRSPIDGIVTKIEPDLGEFISPGSTVIGVMSDGDYKIEAYVPEADIAKISKDNFASTTLDAYGQDIDFPSVVTDIDPAETVLEGVPTYKIILKFVNKDQRIKSGMTANLDILTKEKKDVMVVPTRAIQTNKDGKFLKVVDSSGKKFIEVPVIVGLKGYNGMTEIVSGISPGEKVVTYMK